MRRDVGRVAAGAGLVVAVGGDGTVAALAADLAGTGIPLAIVPGGTGNVLASALGIPNSPSRAIRALRGVSVARSTSASASLAGAPGEPPIERLFAVAAGVGWDARVMAATAGSAQAAPRQARLLGGRARARSAS